MSTTIVKRVATRHYEMILIRHGESEANFGASTSPNSHLTDVGRQQAEDAGRLLSGLDLSKFSGITSPYWRCRETAEIIASQLNQSIDFQPEPLISTMRRKRLAIEFQDDFLIREWGPTAAIDAEIFFEEKIDEFVERVKEFWRLNDSRNLIIVSHASPISVLTQLAMNEPVCTDGHFWKGVGNARPRWIRYLR